MLKVIRQQIETMIEARQIMQQDTIIIAPSLDTTNAGMRPNKVINFLIIGFDSFPFPDSSKVFVSIMSSIWRAIRIANNVQFKIIILDSKSACLQFLYTQADKV